jgi:hypothetical protein
VGKGECVSVYDWGWEGISGDYVCFAEVVGWDGLFGTSYRLKRLLAVFEIIEKKLRESPRLHFCLVVERFFYDYNVDKHGRPSTVRMTSYCRNCRPSQLLQHHLTLVNSTDQQILPR